MTQQSWDDVDDTEDTEELEADEVPDESAHTPASHHMATAEEMDEGHRLGQLIDTEDDEDSGGLGMSQMNAEFIRSLGIDPNQCTSDPLTVTPLDHERIMVRYQGFVMVTAEQMATALTAAAKVTRPESSP